MSVLWIAVRVQYIDRIETRVNFVFFVLSHVTCHKSTKRTIERQKGKNARRKSELRQLPGMANMGFLTPRFFGFFAKNPLLKFPPILGFLGFLKIDTYILSIISTIPSMYSHSVLEVSHPSKLSSTNHTKSNKPVATKET